MSLCPQPNLNQESRMQTPCPRCAGFLVPYSFNHERLDTTEVCHGIRCVNCGFYGDRLMIERWLSYRAQEASV